MVRLLLYELLHLSSHISYFSVWLITIMYYPKSSFRRSYNFEKQSSTNVKKQNEHSKVLLPPSWSGLITVAEPSEAQSRRQSNFSLGLLNINAHPHFRGVIFRNANPIQDIRPHKSYSTNTDALKSLKSLDNRLQKEFHSSFLPEKLGESFDEYDDYDSRSNVDDSKVSMAKAPQYGRDALQSRNIVREFDVTRISPRNSEGMDESPVTYSGLRRESSLSTISSFKLNLEGLDSSHNQFWKSPSYQSTQSIYSDRSDVRSLVSSTGSLMFTSDQSRKEAYDAIKSPRFAEEQLAEVSKLVRQVCDFDGKRRNKRFESDLLRLCDVINAVLQNIPPNILPFRVKKFTKDCTFETTGAFSYDFYLEAEITNDDFEVVFRQGNCNMADIFLTGSNPTLELFCVENELVYRRKQLSPCKLMIIFAHIISARVKDRDFEFPHNASVCYENITDKDIQIGVTFPETYARFVVNFVLAIDVEDFPMGTAFKKSRQWPSATVKQQVQRKGVHLTSKFNDSHLHSWTVTFLKSRRTLLQQTDETGNKLRLLLALQCLRETRLSAPDVLLPAHFATILFWANIKYPTPMDWSSLKLGKRFIDLVVALRRCLWKHECLDFFVPNLNMLEKWGMEDCRALSLKLDLLIKDPVSYLKEKLV